MTEGVIHELGHGHQLTPDERGFVWRHPADKRPGRDCYRIVDTTSGEFHRITARVPLTIEGSLICELPVHSVPVHGFVRDGHWVPA